MKKWMCCVFLIMVCVIGAWGCGSEGTESVPEKKTEAETEARVVDTVIEETEKIVEANVKGTMENPYYVGEIMEFSSIFMGHSEDGSIAKGDASVKVVEYTSEYISVEVTVTNFNTKNPTELFLEAIFCDLVSDKNVNIQSLTATNKPNVDRWGNEFEIYNNGIGTAYFTLEREDYKGMEPKYLRLEGWAQEVTYIYWVELQ